MTDAQDLLEFIRDLHPEVSYPPDELDREPVVVMDQSLWEAIVDDAKTVLARPAPQPETFQARVAHWVDECFGAEVSADKLERGDRLIEEVFELLQSADYPMERVASLASYVWSRPKGNLRVELGDGMNAFAAFATAYGEDLNAAAEAGLERCWENIEKTRVKHAAKPKGTALMQEDPQPARTFTEDEALAMVAADRAENCVNCIGRGVDMHGDPCTHDLPTDATAALARVTEAAEAKGRRETLAAVVDADEALDGEPEYHYQGMGCGLEDRCITDRYEAMQFGWDQAMERVYREHINPAKDALGVFRSLIEKEGQADD